MMTELLLLLVEERDTYTTFQQVLPTELSLYCEGTGPCASPSSALVSTLAVHMFLAGHSTHEIDHRSSPCGAVLCASRALTR